jgi:hypothetical protein
MKKRTSNSIIKVAIFLSLLVLNITITIFICVIYSPYVLFCAQIPLGIGFYLEYLFLERLFIKAERNMNSKK